MEAKEKVIFSIGPLKDVINRCSRFTNPRSLVPEFGYFLFKGNTVRAFNGFAGIMHVLPIGVENDFMIPADLFSKAVLSLTKDVEVQIFDNYIVVRSGGFETKFTLPELDSSKIPINPPGDDFIENSPKGFMASLKQVYFSVSKDETKLGMRGVFLKKDFFYSTDNYRMSRFGLVKEKKEEEKILIDGEWTIPDTLLSLILSEEEPGAYCMEKDKVWFFYNDFLVFGKFPTAPFPSCEGILDRNKSALMDTWKVEYDPAVVEDVLKRLAFFTLKFPYRLDVVVVPNKLVFFVKGTGAEAIEEVPCKTELEGVFPVNIELFTESISKATMFYFTGELIYFISPLGLESILQCLDTKAAEELLRMVKTGKIKQKEENG